MCLNVSVVEPEEESQRSLRGDERKEKQLEKKSEMTERIINCLFV